MTPREALFRSISIAGLNRLAFARTKNALRVLCYHGTWTSSQPRFGNKIFIEPSTFRRRLDILERLRCNVLSLVEALDALDRGTLPSRAVAITIDDGWASTFEFMLPELARRGFPATVYVQTERVLSGAPVVDVATSYALANARTIHIELPPRWATRGCLDPGTKLDLRDRADRTRLSGVLEDLFAATPQNEHLALLWRIFELLHIDPEDFARTRVFQLATPAEIRGAASAGFEIALHTHSHTLGDFSSDAMEREIEANRTALAEMIEKPKGSFNHFCWPSGEYTAGSSEQLARLGITVATTCDEGFVTRKSARLLLPRVLDGELTSASEFVARLSGAKGALARGQWASR